MALSDKVVIMKAGKIAQVGSPKEIYQKPNSEFVAKFIGRANILDAKIVAKEDNKTIINILGVNYAVDEEVQYELNENCKVVIRPESIKFDSKNHKLKVTKSVFMGENHEYEVEMEDEIIEITLNNPNGKDIKEVNDYLEFSFDERAIHIL